ncbi:MAG: acetyl-CoA carboxylase, biotin carboxyl carrier protein, partial [Chitinophagaceae bacterium]|nr:acetyl-CoA carboxylase, biotin carboxyl carrier protein [Chitinophagaceae bacterium]
MDLKHIQELIKAVNKSEISELSIKDGDFEITIKHTNSEPHVVYQAAPAPQPVAAHAPQAAAPAPQAPPAAAAPAPAPAGDNL